MLWETNDNTVKKITLDGKKIVKISNGWHIDSVILPDNKKRSEIRSLTITIKRDSDKEN